MSAARRPLQVLRALPALVAFTLLGAAAMSATRPAPPRGPVAVPDAVDYANCAAIAQGSDQSDSAVTLPYNGGLSQPLLGQMNLVACSLGVVPAGHYGTLYAHVVQWDPVAMAPDPTTAALRSQYYYVSAATLAPIEFPFVPPVVSRRIPGLADPPSSTLALDFTSYFFHYSFGNELAVRYGGEASAELPVAYQYASYAGARVPLPGEHPVLKHSVCSGDEDQQHLYLVQSVATCTSAVPYFASYDVLQRFRVPQECQLRWIEVAANDTLNFYNFPGGSIGIVDGDGQPTPPTSLAAPLVSAPFSVPQLSGWISHFDFDRIITLEPDHDYWLWMADRMGVGLAARQLTGTESATFTNGVGPLFYRADGTSAFSYLPGRVLSFKLIGVPLGAVGVAPEPPTVRASFALRAAPNPAHGAVMLAWSGARGAVRIEVLDARGRRVGGGAAGGAGAGQWLWNAARTGGGPVAPGVYFVRARDAAGAVASERVTIVR